MSSELVHHALKLAHRKSKHQNVRFQFQECESFSDEAKQSCKTWESGKKKKKKKSESEILEVLKSENLAHKCKWVELTGTHSSS